MRLGPLRRHRKLGLAPSFVIGHEAAGEIVDDGDSADEYAAGIG
jgi:threonine dehydrogenase-like Zn-dependent dehydrogenase